LIIVIFTCIVLIIESAITLHGVFMIILIGGEKGGTGKTTIATNLAVHLKQNKRDVLLIDTDKQGSASFWSNTRDVLIRDHIAQQNKLKNVVNENIREIYRIPNVQKFGDAIVYEINDLKTRYEDIIIDAGGRDSLELRASITVAEFLYIPIQASQFDVWTLGVLDNLITQAKIYNKNLKSFVLFNRASTNPIVNEVMESEHAIKNDFENFILCKSILRDRIIYRKAAKNGLSINELNKQDFKANEEFEQFYKEVLNGIQ
jgi:chromosome partitioning protein